MGCKNIPAPSPMNRPEVGKAQTTKYQGKLRRVKSKPKVGEQISLRGGTEF